MCLSDTAGAMLLPHDGREGSPCFTSDVAQAQGLVRVISGKPKHPLSPHSYGNELWASEPMRCPKALTLKIHINPVCCYLPTKTQAVPFCSSAAFYTWSSQQPTQENWGANPAQMCSFSQKLWKRRFLSSQPHKPPGREETRQETTSKSPCETTPQPRALSHPWVLPAAKQLPGESPTATPSTKQQEKQESRRYLPRAEKEWAIHKLPLPKESGTRCGCSGPEESRHHEPTPGAGALGCAMVTPRHRRQPRGHGQEPQPEHPGNDSAALEKRYKVP